MTRRICVEKRSADRRQKRPQKDAGFTLVEILVVLAILGILGAVVAPQLMGARDQARVTKAIVEIRTFSEALERYALDTGDYPASDEGLLVLAVEPEDVDGWNGPYVRGILTPDGTVKSDPWGNLYVYVFPGEHEELGYAYDLISYGKDGKEGGTRKYEDDITNWDTGEGTRATR